jgi:hypothetical protein
MRQPSFPEMKRFPKRSMLIQMQEGKFQPLCGQRRMERMPTPAGSSLNNRLVRRGAIHIEVVQPQAEALSSNCALHPWTWVMEVWGTYRWSLACQAQTCLSTNLSKALLTFFLLHQQQKNHIHHNHLFTKTLSSRALSYPSPTPSCQFSHTRRSDTSSLLIFVYHPSSQDFTQFPQRLHVFQ